MYTDISCSFGILVSGYVLVKIRLDSSTSQTTRGAQHGLMRCRTKPYCFCTLRTVELPLRPCLHIDSPQPYRSITRHESRRLPLNITTVLSTSKLLHNARAFVDVVIVSRRTCCIMYRRGKKRNEAVISQWMNALDTDLSHSWCQRGALVFGVGYNTIFIYICLLYTSPSPRD